MTNRQIAAVLRVGFFFRCEYQMMAISDVEKRSRKKIAPLCNGRCRSLTNRSSNHPASFGRPGIIP